MRQQAQNMKMQVTVLKQRSVEVLQGLAKKEYLSNPDNIFDFKENNKTRHLTKEVDFEIKKALADFQ